MLVTNKKIMISDYMNVVIFWVVLGIVGLISIVALIIGSLGYEKAKHVEDLQSIVEKKSTVDEHGQTSINAARFSKLPSDPEEIRFTEQHGKTPLVVLNASDSLYGRKVDVALHRVGPYAFSAVIHDIPSLGVSLHSAPPKTGINPYGADLMKTTDSKTGVLMVSNDNYAYYYLAGDELGSYWQHPVEVFNATCYPVVSMVLSFQNQKNVLSALAASQNAVYTVVSSNAELETELSFTYTFETATVQQLKLLDNDETPCLVYLESTGTNPGLKVLPYSESKQTWDVDVEWKTAAGITANTFDAIIDLDTNQFYFCWNEAGTIKVGTAAFGEALVVSTVTTTASTTSLTKILLINEANIRTPMVVWESVNNQLQWLSAVGGVWKTEFIFNIPLGRDESRIGNSWSAVRLNSAEPAVFFYSQMNQHIWYYRSAWPSSQILDYGNYNTLAGLQAPLVTAVVGDPVVNYPALLYQQDGHLFVSHAKDNDFVMNIDLIYSAHS